eukprot:TRINITY_DN7028_c0_g1_i1.p1 TRINITY_DN7028_c0_g1~~TRINITY_DN7028_c0_g1_i1.p1  ORF type:complete len:309 (-),score=102.89 TRINITY_DN7028_c0_g1_i1:74-1000(-)
MSSRKRSRSTSSSSNEEIPKKKKKLNNNKNEENDKENDNKINRKNKYKGVQIANIDVIDLSTEKSLIPTEKINHQLFLIQKEIEKLEKELKTNKEEVLKNKKNEEEVDLSQAFTIPEHSIPIRTDVRTFDWDQLSKSVQFDVIMMDPPWQLASRAPTRGVALSYSQLPNKDIELIPIEKLQTNGFLFIWVINSRYAFTLELFKQWGYKLVDDISWVKSTVNRRLAKGHGFYLQHAKETCLVGKKGDDSDNICYNIASDVIFSERRGQSQKPEEIYELIEELVPNGKYLEIFARRNNLRNYWASIGLKL